MIFKCVPGVTLILLFLARIQTVKMLIFVQNLVSIKIFVQNLISIKIFVQNLVSIKIFLLTTFITGGTDVLDEGDDFHPEIQIAANITLFPPAQYICICM